MQPNQHYKFGDIILVDIPFTDGSGSKKRPVLVYNEDGHDYLIIKMTSNGSQQESLDVVLQPDGYNNLIQTTVLQIGKTFLIHKQFVVARLGELSKADKKVVIERLHNFIDTVTG